MEKYGISQPITPISCGQNYTLDLSLLIGHKLWCIVTGDFIKPTKEKDENDTKFTDRLEGWDSKNHHIITWFRNTSVLIITLQRKSRISWLIGIKPLDLPIIISYGLHFTVLNKDLVNLSMISLLKSNQFGINYLKPKSVKITCISSKYSWHYDLNMNLSKPLFYFGIHSLH
ncbi:hypothetical protein SADUNF_Sadunf10G0080300 [Salix dunnii]|uniref:Uncharacterized protein n=1 Tax=Salix dunnii TaxID=1413687 RepID=A0A835JRN3_9ROSI|nr:hypothetical protein SADUNF_Sadunf10G0080300 [Salix dunnii]